MKPKTRKLLTITSILLSIFVATISVTYAFFTATITGNESATSIAVKTADLSITYSSGSTITGNNLLPGWSESKQFTVKNNSVSTTVYYDIVWTEIINTFGDKNDLVYTLTGANGKSETVFPSSEANILTGIELLGNALHTYTLTVTFKNQAYNQVSNMGKMFAGKIEIREGVATQTAEVTNLLINGSFEVFESWAWAGPQVTTKVKFSTYSMYVHADTMTDFSQIYQMGHSHYAGHKYYSSSWFYFNTIGTETIYFSGMGGAAISTSTIPLGEWHQISYVSTPVSTLIDNDIYQCVFSDALMPAEVWLDGFMVIDLTESFGAGNEPSKEQMDAIVNANGGFWDGTKTVTY